MQPVGELLQPPELARVELGVVLGVVTDQDLGEVRVEGLEVGPILRSEPDETPYPEVMNRAAVAEITAIAPDAVVAKGDLTATGTRQEYQQFLDCYGPAFGERLAHVRGNHDGYFGETFADRCITSWQGELGHSSEAYVRKYRVPPG